MSGDQTKWLNKKKAIERIWSESWPWHEHNFQVSKRGKEKKISWFINFVFYELKSNSGQLKDQVVPARQKTIICPWMSDAPVKVLNN